MKKDRNKLEEIVNLNKRSETNISFLYIRLFSIENSLNQVLNINNSEKQELLKYLPISLVALMEVYFKSVIKELIDFSDKFIENSIKVSSVLGLKLDFNILKAVENKKVTGGEIFAHSFTINNLNDINNLIKGILGIKDFLDELKNFEIPNYKKSFSTDEQVNSFAELKKNKKDFFKFVIKCFELRHIFCHEVVKTDFEVSEEEIKNCFYSVKNFLIVSDEYFQEIFYPNAIIVQNDINSEKETKYNELNEKMNIIFEKIKFLYNENTLFIKNLESCQNTWLEYRRLFIESLYPEEDKLYHYGSINKMCQYLFLSDLTENRIEQLNLWINGVKEGSYCVGTIKINN